VAVRPLTFVALVLPVLVVALVVPLLPPGYSWQRWLVGLPCVLVFLYGGLQPLLWWWGADLWVDETGVGFGRERDRRRPAQATFAARNRWQVRWDEIAAVRLVRDRHALRAMRRAARAGSGAPQPTVFAGYFPAVGRATLLFTVDPDQVGAPEVRPPSSRRGLSFGQRGVALRPSRTWAFPVRDVAALTAALGEHGVPPVETDEPALPGTTPVPGTSPIGPDDAYVVETLTRNLGRPPTEEERAQLRRDWSDTDRFPERP
jgi:hypothetical protein